MAEVLLTRHRKELTHDQQQVRMPLQFDSIESVSLVEWARANASYDDLLNRRSTFTRWQAASARVRLATSPFCKPPCDVVRSAPPVDSSAILTFHFPTGLRDVALFGLMGLYLSGQNLNNACLAKLTLAEVRCGAVCPLWEVPHLIPAQRPLPGAFAQHARHCRHAWR